MKKEKINSLDFAKFIMAIFVICLHTHPFIKIEPLPLFEIITNSAVPFFFMTSSFLLFRKYYNSKEDLTIIWDYTKKMIKMYIIWSIIYFPLAIYGYVFINRGGGI